MAFCKNRVREVLIVTEDKRKRTECKELIYI